MNHPKTPFSTPLSRNARETELRIRSIFRWQKRRPPALLLTLAALLALGCGGLVSCTLNEPKTPEVPVPDKVENLTVETGTEDTEQVFPVTESFTRSLLVDEIYEDATVGLSREQKELLEDLPAADLPTQAWDVTMGVPKRGVWQDTLIPVAHEAGVTLYLAGFWEGESWNEVGIVLSTGKQAEYFPFYRYHDRQPQLWVRDFDEDGALEAAITLHAGHGTGVTVDTLYIFELDPITCHQPDYTTLDISMTHHPERHHGESHHSGDHHQKRGTITIAGTLNTVEFPVPEECQGVHGLYTGHWVGYHCEGDKLYCDMSLNLSDIGLTAVADATARVVCRDGRWVLTDTEIVPFDY